MKKIIIPLMVLFAMSLIMCNSSSNNSETSNSNSIDSNTSHTTKAAKKNKDIVKKDYVKKSFDADAKSVKTDIEFAFGELKINCIESKKFFNGEFMFTRPEWKPNISYQEENNKGNLKIDLGEIEIDNKNNEEEDNCEWKLNFDRKTENEVSIRVLAGEADINFAKSNLKAFNFKMLAGDIDINLQNTSVPHINFKALAGEANIDLSGKWKNDLHGIFKGGVGELTIKVPSDVGIKAEITGLLGSKNVHGLHKNGSTYTNALYGDSETTLYLDITGGIGDVTIEMVD